MRLSSSTNPGQRHSFLRAIVSTHFSLCGLALLLIVYGSGLWATPAAHAQDATEALVSQSDLTDMKRKTPDYFRALSSGSLNQSEINLLKDVMRVQVHQMTMPEMKNDLSDIRERLRRDLDLRAKEAAKGVVLPEIVSRAKELFNYPLAIRLNAVMLIGDLNQQAAQLGKGIPAVPYEGMGDALSEVLVDENQPEAVKIAAANGLKRLCEDGNPRVQIRKRIATAAISELNREGLHYWYKLVLIQCAAAANDLYDNQRRPYVIQKLMEMLVDQKQEVIVRAEAAHALGHTAMNGEINLSLINYEIVRFAREMGQMYNQKPRRTEWRYCAGRLYLAYKPEVKEGDALLPKVSGGALAKFRGDVTEGYNQVLTVVNGILAQPPRAQKAMSGQILQDVQEWLDANTPTDFKVGPNSPPIRQPNN